MSGSMFSLELVDLDGLSHLHISGDVGAWSKDWLDRAVRSLVTEGRPAIVLDLSAVSAIDESGVRTVLRAQRIAADAGTYVLLGPTSEATRQVVDAADARLDLTCALEGLRFDRPPEPAGRS